MARFHNRVAPITGGGRGIGWAIALAFAEEGARVAVTARTASELEEVIGSIRGKGGQAVALTADLADAAPARRLGPEEVAPLAVYLAGDGARMVTGQAMNVCGGICTY
ncbi:MAG TPA: SDR family oxidoreductase [Gemmataceae bacterium]|nr:SDR family oxidoreductase [Gemmataceae bacterium]